MDFNLIHHLAEKAIATPGRIATEQLAASTPGLRERHDDIVIHDDAERGKVVVQFPERVDERTRRVLKIYGFSGDGATYWRKRTFRRARTWRSTMRATSWSGCSLTLRSSPRRRRQLLNAKKPPAIDKAKQRDVEGGWL